MLIDISTPFRQSVDQKYAEFPLLASSKKKYIWIKKEC